jgi:hypothetical protein
MSKTRDLRGVFLKLDRAETHIDTLRNETQAFLGRKPKPFEIRPEKEPGPNNSMQYVLYAIVREEPPPELAPIIGDVIHNLRSALEQLAHELSDRKRKSQFPIFTDECEFKVKGRPMMKGITGDERTLIENVQPYVASNPARTDPLAILNELSNLDKHRLPIPVVAALNMADCFVGVTNAKISWDFFEPGPVKHDAKILAFTATPEDPTQEMHVHPQSGLQIQLTDTGADDFYGDMSAIAVLEMLSHHVRHSIIHWYFTFGQIPKTWAEIHAGQTPK